MKQSQRPYKAGWSLADSLCEVGHILYLLDNRHQFLQGLYDRIGEELESLPAKNQNLTPTIGKNNSIS